MKLEQNPALVYQGTPQCGDADHSAKKKSYWSPKDSGILLLETGMGGEFDATNVLPSTLCSIITTISFDHQDFLGKTLKEIAKAKAGIIKQNGVVFCAKQEKGIMEVITEEALRKKAKLIFYDDEVLQELALQRFLEKIDFANLQFGLEGEHQKENAKLAILCALSQENFKIKLTHIYQGLKAASWPARLQKIESGSLFSLLKPGSRLYLDGSHNLEGAKTLQNFLQKHRKTSKNKTPKAVIIFSMLNDKDCYGFLSAIAQEIAELIIIPIPNQARARSVSEIFKIAESLKIRAKTANNFQEALLIASKTLSPAEERLIIISGSLFLAGEFLSLNR